MHEIIALQETKFHPHLYFQKIVLAVTQQLCFGIQADPWAEHDGDELELWLK